MSLAQRLSTVAYMAVIIVGLNLATGATQPVPRDVAPECAGDTAASPDVVLCEDFEDGTFLQHWDIGSSSDVWPSSEFVRCDGFGFRDRCAAWSNELVFDSFFGFWGYDAWRRFPPQDEFYLRWYQYISEGYVWGTLEDKSLILHDPAGPNDPVTITAVLATSRNQLPTYADSGPGMPFVANYQDLDWDETGGQFTKVNRFQNQGNNITLEAGKWYLFEWYVKLNTPGVSDGLTSLWIDEASRPITRQTLRLHYDDMRWLRPSDAGKQFGIFRLTVYHQRCDGVPNTCPPDGPALLAQSHRWDRIVLSTSPVGPVADPPVCDGAHAVPGTLWPPNHRFVPITIAGVTHPAGDPVSITILDVTQDEPVHDAANQRNDSDAIVEGDRVLLRAERLGGGNGRIYEIAFVAQASGGGQCTGTVRVGVPHSMAPGLSLIDDGQRYTSTAR